MKTDSHYDDLYVYEAPDLLSKLAMKYGADKFGKHNYTPFYYDLFKDRRESVKKVVEVGVAEGASLLMWNDFFPNAKIYGADIDTDRIPVELFKDKPRVEAYKIDQSSVDDLYLLLHKVGTDIDLFLDDGSHKPEDQLLTCVNVFPKLNKGAIYIIEDVADDVLSHKISHYFNCKMHKFSERYDDRIIILKK